MENNKFNFWSGFTSSATFFYSENAYSIRKSFKPISLEKNIVIDSGYLCNIEIEIEKEDMGTVPETKIITQSS